VPEQESIEFLRLQYAGRIYLISVPWLWRTAAPPWWIEEFFHHPHWWRIARGGHLPISDQPNARLGWFAIEENGGAEFLNGLSAIIRDSERRAPASFTLPTFDPVGFGLTEGDRTPDEEDGAYDYARFRDGLALLGDPFRGKPLDVLVWSPNEGLSLK